MPNEEKLEKEEIKKEKNENENNNIIDNSKTKIDELIKKIEEIKNEKMIIENKNKELEEKNNKLNEVNIKLNNKLKQLKESVLQLKIRLEKDIYLKLENKSKELKEQISQNDILNKKIKILNDDIEKYKLIDEEFKLFREKFNLLIKDKSKMDSLSLKQEEKMKNLEEEILILNKECKEKDNRYKKLTEGDYDHYDEIQKKTDEKNSLYINHYAGTVKYNIKDIVKKNVLETNYDINRAFKESSNTLINELFKDKQDEPIEGKAKIKN